MKRNIIIGILAGAIALIGIAATTRAASVFAPREGGTGTSTAPAYGQLLVGNSNGTYTLTATSSLGISGGSGLSFGYLFPNNATSTLLIFNGGLTAYASSTIGSGAQTGGLTISGGATTTGNAYIAGKTGVATTSPYAKLSVHQNTSDTQPFVFTVGSSTASANSTLFTVRNNGNVGINTTYPTSALHVVGSAYITGSITSTSYLMASASNLIGWSGASLMYSTADGVIKFKKYSSSDFVRLQLGGETSAFPAIGRHDANINIEGADGSQSANLGVGTSSPYAKLSVVGEVVASHFTATTSTASTFPYASTTALSIEGKTVSPTYDKSFVIASTTPDSAYRSFSTATSSFMVWNPSVAIAATALYCKTTSGTVTVELGTGSATTTAVCTTSGTAVSSALAWAARGNVFINAGNIGSAANSVTVTPTFYNQ